MAFPTPSDGLNAAIDAQRKLQLEDWGETPIRVRMGLHTGEAEIQGSEYRGYLTLSLVQRIMSAGHGEQILLSNATEALVRSHLPKQIYLRDMGEYKFKDVVEPIRVFQIVAPDVQNEFPPLRALDVFPNNLPIQLTSFVGRHKEIGQIKKRLEQYRQVTLTGSGGVGKSRLSIEVASEVLTDYPGGAWLVELAPITDPSLVTQTVCAALDVTPQGDATALNVLMDYLQPKKTLLVVDNCEHLIDACAQLCDSLLHACPDLRIIASSREALGIDGENAYRVPSLSLSDPNNRLENIKQSEAVQLFVERANTILPGYTLTETNASNIAEICRRLDGIALAIELAASRVKLLKVDQIKARLEDAFRLLTGGSRTALPRQQTLRATIDWSYNLLSDQEQTTLRYLSVFVGGWTFEAAESVCDNANMLDLLSRLVDKSLVVVDREHSLEPRYYLLETIRQYAREKLAESHEGEQIRDRHLDYFLKLTQKAEPELYGSGQIEWAQRLEDEHENMRAALQWSLLADVMVGQQLTVALWWAWNLNGHLREAYEWIKKMLSVNPQDKTIIRAKLLSEAGWFAAMLSDGGTARKLSEESVVLFREFADEIDTALPFVTLGVSAFWVADYEQSAAYAHASLDIFKRAGNQWGASQALRLLGGIAEIQEDFLQAQKFYQESLSISKEIGDQTGIADALRQMGNLAALEGKAGRAMQLYEEALAVERIVKNKPAIVETLTVLSSVAIYNGDFQRGKQLLEEALEICRKMGDGATVSRTLRYLGWIARLQAEYPKAQSLYSESLQLACQVNDERGIASSLIHVGNLILLQGSAEKFAYLLGIVETSVPEAQKTLLPFFRIEIEKFKEKARAALGDDAYTAAYNAGHQMSLDEAVVYALKELQ